MYTTSRLGGNEGGGMYGIVRCSFGDGIVRCSFGACVAWGGSLVWVAQIWAKRALTPLYCGGVSVLVWAAAGRLLW